MKIHREEHKTIILITHNPELAEEAERQITLSDGMITGDFYNSDISRLKCEAMGVKA